MSRKSHPKDVQFLILPSFFHPFHNLIEQILECNLSLKNFNKFARQWSSKQFLLLVEIFHHYVVWLVNPMETFRTQMPRKEDLQTFFGMAVWMLIFPVLLECFCPSKQNPQTSWSPSVWKALQNSTVGYSEIGIKFENSLEHQKKLPPQLEDERQAGIEMIRLRNDTSGCLEPLTSFIPESSSDGVSVEGQIEGKKVRKSQEEDTPKESLCVQPMKTLGSLEGVDSAEFCFAVTNRHVAFLIGALKNSINQLASLSSLRSTSAWTCVSVVVTNPTKEHGYTWLSTTWLPISQSMWLDGCPTTNLLMKQSRFCHALHFCPIVFKSWKGRFQFSGKVARCKGLDVLKQEAKQGGDMTPKVSIAIGALLRLKKPSLLEACYFAAVLSQGAWRKSTTSLVIRALGVWPSGKMSGFFRYCRCHPPDPSNFTQIWKHLWLISLGYIYDIWWHI